MIIALIITGIELTVIKHGIFSSVYIIMLTKTYQEIYVEDANAPAKPLFTSDVPLINRVRERENKE